jgi:CheY-like chemotaxis protein
MSGTPATATRLKVLVVEDHHDTADSLKVLLRSHGHDVAIANDGPTALRMAQEHPPDVALLDFGLPMGMSGCEVARRLRAQATGKTLLLIAITGYGQDEDRRRSAEAGFHLHLLKPADPEALLRLLDNYRTSIGK